MRLSLQDCKKLPRKVGTDKCLTLSTRNNCIYVHTRPTNMFGRIFRMIFFFLLLVRNWFFTVCLHKLFAAASNFFSTTYNFCNFFRTKNQRVGTDTFFSWEDLSTQICIFDHPKAFAIVPTLLAFCPPIPPQNGNSTYLWAAILNQILR